MRNMRYIILHSECLCLIVLLGVGGCGLSPRVPGSSSHHWMSPLSTSLTSPHSHLSSLHQLLTALQQECARKNLIHRVKFVQLYNYNTD